MSRTAWDDFKKQLQAGAYNNYERELGGSLSVVDKDEEAKRRYREYVQQVMASERQAEIVKNQIREAEEANRVGHSATGMVTAGAAQTPQQPSPEMAPEIDLRGVNANRTQRTIDRIKAEVDDQHNLYNMLGLKKSDDLGTQANDIKVENYIPESVKANDKKRINELDQKINRGRTLTPDEEVQYSDATLRELYKKYPGLEKLMIERNDYYSAANAIANGAIKSNGNTTGSMAYRGYADNKRQLVEDEIKKLTGWDDNELHNVLMYANRTQNREDTQAESKRFEIDPNASREEQLLKAAGNTAYGLVNNRFIANVSAWNDNRNSERPRGFGADIDSSAYRTINNANAASAEARKAVGRDVAKMGYALGGETAGKAAAKSATWLYDTAYSSADSMLNQIPALVAEAAATKVVGAQAGKAIGEAVGLVPYYFKSYNQGYMDARNRGATEEESNYMGIASGATEVLTELLPMSNYIDNRMGKNAAKSFVKTFIKQGIEEGMEEAVGTLAEEAIDAFVFSDDPEVKSKFENRMQETGSFAGAVWDLVLETLSSAASGFVSAAPSSVGSQAIGVHNYNKMGQQISQNAQEAADSIKGDSDYEKSVKAQMEQYSKNPTRYIADNMAENTEEDKQRKAEVMELAKKEEAGEELTAGEKLFIEGAMEESMKSQEKAAKEAKKQAKNEAEQEPQVPTRFMGRVSNWTEDEARARLGEAAKAGDTQAYLEAMEMTRNSSNKDVAARAEEIISGYSGMAMDNGITKEEMGKALISQKQAYLDGLKGKEVDKESLSDKNKVAYNQGQIDALKSKERTVLGKDALINTDIKTKKGDTIKLGGTFNADGKINTSDGSIRYEDLDLSQDNAVMKAYKEADTFDDISVKNTFLNNIKEGVNIDDYTRDFNRAFDSGLAGVSLEQAKKGFTTLDDEAFQAAYDAGARENQTKTVDSLAKALGVKTGGTGKMINESKLASNETVDFLTKLAKRMGIDIRLVDNMDQKGARGSFQVGKSLITVKVDSADAVFHELGEFTETYNKKEYDALRNAIADFSSKKLGHDTYMRLLKGEGEFKGYTGTYAAVAGQDTSADEMSGEMFNDIIPLIMRSDKGRDALVNYLAENYSEDEAKTLGQQISDYMHKLADAVKKLAGLDSNKNSYVKAMSKYSDELGEYADQFVKALDKAVENYHKAQAGENTEDEEKFAITIDSTEEQRYNELKDKVITIPRYNKQTLDKAIKDLSIGELKNRSISNAQDSIVKLARKLGVIDKYQNPHIDVQFYFSGNKLNESLHLQRQLKAGDSEALKYAELLSCFRGVVDNAELIKVGKDRYEGEQRQDDDLDKMYYLISAFTDDEGIVPVKLEVKDFKKKDDVLHVAIVLPTIEMTRIMGVEPRNKSLDRIPSKSFSKFRLADLLTEVKNDPASESLGKYIPDQFATDQKFSLTVDSDGRELSEGQQEFYSDESPLLLDDKGALKRYYHGTARKDRVGTVFDPARATSGPMAFFTDNKSIAENYAKDKQDTSISRDERYDSYYTQFRLNMNGKDVSVSQAWYLLPSSKKQEIMQKAGHIAFDEDYDEISYYPNKTEGNGNFNKYELNRHKNNYLETLVDTWLESGDLLDREEDFLKVLELVGIEGAEYLDPYARDEGVFEVYIHATKPLDTSNIPKKVVTALKKRAKTVEFIEGDMQADMWDKNNVRPEQWIARLEDDIKGNTTHSWTSIPDWVTEVLKEQGYDAISDLGGKGGGAGHQVVIPFASNQVKNIDNLNPTENSDIRFNLDIDEDRVYLAPRLNGNLEIVKNATDEEYRQMREDILKEMPWLRGTDTPLLRHTYDEEGNTYYWSAADGIHAQVEPLINKHWNTRTSQHWEWWKREDKDDYPIDYDKKYSLTVDSDGKQLTEGQQRYFNNSKARDDEDNLMVLYHGTPRAGFDAFDERDLIYLTPDRWLANKFTDNPFKGNEIYDPKTKKGSIYKMYANITNPLIVDATHNILKGKVDANIEYNENSGKYNLVLTNSDGKDYRFTTYDLSEYFDEKTVNQISNYFDKHPAKSYYDNAKYSIKGKAVNINKPSSYYNIEFNGEKVGTDNIAEYAKANGYDGVIIKNVVEGFDASINGEPTTDVIVFRADQVKDVNNLNPTSSHDIRYALEDIGDEGGWVSAEDLFSDTKATEEKAVDILAKGMEALKNKEVDVPRLRTLALKLRNEFGSTYNTNTLTENLRKAFAFMQTEDHVDYQTMMGILRDIARPVIEASGEKVGEQEYKDFINHFKGKKIKLTEKQKEEVRYTFGSYGAFRNAMMPLTISDKADTTLDQVWDELVEQTGYALDRDTSEGDMPAALLDTLQAMRPTVRNDFGGDMEDLSKDLAMRIVEEYLEGEAAKQMKAEVSEYRARLKKAYNDRMKEARGKANAEVRARNKRQAEQKQEREAVRDLKHAIKMSANKLLTWIEKPTEGKSVPHNMVVPIVQFLQAIDFVDPVIVQTDSGKWHTRVFDHMDYDNGRKQYHFKELVGDTYEDVLRQFNEAIGRGIGSKDQRSWTEKMQGIRDIYNKVLNDDDFEDTSMDFLMQGLDAAGLAEDFDDLLSRNRGEANMNHLDSKDLTLINNILNNIFHAVNQGNKAYSSPSVDIVNLAQSTMQDAEGKELKSRNTIMEKLHKYFRIDNLTPRTFFELLGKRGHEVYKFVRDGLNQEILDLKKASEYMEEAMTGYDRKEVKKWTGKNATIHEFALTNGSIKMTDAQIMGLYKTLHREGAMERIKGGVKIEGVYENGKELQQEAVHLTDQDISKIFAVLTPEQIALADKMQKYMATDCAAMGNETSQKLYGFKKFTEPNYYPYTVDRDTVNSRNVDENVSLANGIERSGFTKQLKEGAKNPLIIRDIFDVFSDHVADMAAYHGYAAACKDVMRWMNYREKSAEDGFIKWYTNKNAINRLAGSKQGTGYIFKLLLDINQANKSQYIGGITDVLMGHYKAAAVGANLRVIAQQPTAYFRALNQIDPKYLLSVNPKVAVDNIKKSQEQSPISWWKSKGYYETNLGQPIKEIVTGMATPTEALKDKLMAPAGWADDFTWGFLYTAVEKEQRDKLRGQDLTEEEFRKAVNERFDEVIDNTQVVDSTIHRSQYMRSKDTLNKIQTAFMAEPTKSYNMLFEAIFKDLNNKDRTGKLTRRATAAFLISALATSAASAVVDAMRKAHDDDDWWEVWLKNLKANMADNMNPFNLLPVVKDVSAAIYNQITGESTFGQSGNRFDIEAISSFMNAVNAWTKLFEGESKKTGYGMFLATVKPISQITGIPAYNLTRDIVSLYNTFFENVETTVETNNTKKNEKKKDFVTDVSRERSEATLDKSIIDAINNGVSIYDLKGAMQNEYKSKYFEAYTEGEIEDAQEIAERAARAYARMGLSDEEIDKIINEWQEEVITYAELDKAIADGGDIEQAVARVQEAKEDDKIIKHLYDRYAETIDFERTHETESQWAQNVQRAIFAIEPGLGYYEAFDDIREGEAKKAEKAAQTEKNNAIKTDFYDAVEKKDGAAGRKALETMKSEGVEAKSIKASISTRYHEIWKESESQADKDKARSDWKSAYTLVNNVYGVTSNNLDKTWSDWEKEQI